MTISRTLVDAGGGSPPALFQRRPRKKCATVPLAELACARTCEISSADSTRLPRAVTFNVDFSTLKKPARVLLLAVVHSQVDPVTLPNQSLQSLVLGTRFVALRSLEIV